jgi:aryl-alcohol dehydrogenase-like predicted oxidoreductase
MRILGTSSVGHLHENLAAADLALTHDAIAALHRITTNRAATSQRASS